MKALHIVLILLLAVVASAAFVAFRPAAPQSVTQAVVQTIAQPVVTVEQAVPLEAMVTPAVAPVPESVADEVQPVQPVEERGDAMLFEIEALGTTPFDQSITMPFE